MGLTWGLAWSVVGMVPRWVFGFNSDAPFPLVFGVFGFIAGIIFFGVLALTEGRRSLDQMSFSRFAVWGVTGGLLLSAFFVRAASFSGAEALLIAPTFALACGISAVGSLALARRAARKELPEGRGDIGAPKVTDNEMRKLI
jgi:hypothetical protein